MANDLSPAMLALVVAVQSNDGPAIIEAYADLTDAERSGKVAEAALPLVEAAILQRAVDAARAEAARLGLPVRSVGAVKGDKTDPKRVTAYKGRGGFISGPIDGQEGTYASLLWRDGAGHSA